jgi:hypothetical protein
MLESFSDVAKHKNIKINYSIQMMYILMTKCRREYLYNYVCFCFPVVTIICGPFPELENISL